MSYLAYLYDKTGELWRVDELGMPYNPYEAVIYLPIRAPAPLECIPAPVTMDMPPRRYFWLKDQGQTVRGLPRLIYQERA